MAWRRFKINPLIQFTEFQSKPAALVTVMSAEIRPDAIFSPE
jgi:hypothetical protein